MTVGRVPFSLPLRVMHGRLCRAQRRPVGQGPKSITKRENGVLSGTVGLSQAIS